MSPPDEMLTLVPLRARGFAPAHSRYGGALAIVAFLGLWQAATFVASINPLFLPSPARVAVKFYELVVQGELPRHVAASLRRISLGWTLGASCGIAVGMMMGLYTLARAAGFALVSALFPIPKIALLPLMILWLGIGETSKIATIALGVFFPMAIAAAGGVDACPRNLIAMGQSFGLPARDIIAKIVAPAALPSILSGCRISASIALLLVVSAEMIGADEGLGAFVLQAGNLMQTDKLIAGVAALSMIGLVVARVLAYAERRLLSWR
jgi:NitT/TauT family transport system permease protein